MLNLPMPERGGFSLHSAVLASASLTGCPWAFILSGVRSEYLQACFSDVDGGIEIPNVLGFTPRAPQSVDILEVHTMWYLLESTTMLFDL